MTERGLRDEIIYLHSLWSLGPPPRQNPNFSTSTTPSHFFNNNPSSTHLHVTNTRPFKNTKRTKPRNHRNLSASGSHSLPDPGPEWPIVVSSNSSGQSSSGWPVFAAKPGTLARTDPVKATAVDAQQKVVKCCSEFFRKMVGFDGDEDGEFDDDDDEGDDGDSAGGGGEEESEEFKFFLNLFVKNQPLRELYEKNQENGAFYCLVCGGIGVKVGKKYKGCLSLIQHAIAISKTKKRRVNRALGHVICKVVGWGFSKLPVTVLKGEPLSWSLANSNQNQDGLKEDGCKKLFENIDNGVFHKDASTEGDLDCEVR